jgi:hypothetical protein
VDFGTITERRRHAEHSSLHHLIRCWCGRESRSRASRGRGNLDVNNLSARSGQESLARGSPRGAFLAPFRSKRQWLNPSKPWVNLSWPLRGGLWRQESGQFSNIPRLTRWSAPSVNAQFSNSVGGKPIHWTSNRVGLGVEPCRSAYFTAPKVSPWTSCFWVSQPSTIMGATASKEAAESLAKNRPSGLE